MAPKQLGRKKTRDVKRKTTQKKHQQVGRKQKKLQPQKQRKRQSPLKRQVKRTSAKKAATGEPKRICSPRLFASKILRQMPKVRMEANARGLVKTLLTDLYNQVATEVETLSQKDEASTITCADVQTALKGAMVKELAKHMAEPTTNECA